MLVRTSDLLPISPKRRHSGQKPLVANKRQKRRVIKGPSMKDPILEAETRDAIQCTPPMVCLGPFQGQQGGRSEASPTATIQRSNLRRRGLLYNMGLSVKLQISINR